MQALSKIYLWLLGHAKQSTKAEYSTEEPKTLPANYGLHEAF